jgi:2-oxoglutarate dehydrogenase E2 component (dihydrolipoamide succinyltransferase)
MATNIVIPPMGESVPSGVVSRWLKNDGDAVNRDEVVLELETDKITMEVVAPAAGRLVQSATIGDTVAVGATVGRVEEGAGAAAAPAPAKQPAPAPAAAQAPAPAPTPAKSEPARTNAHAATADVRTTPLARKIASEQGVDLKNVPATGVGGRVSAADVLGATSTTAPAPAKGANGTPAAAPAPAPAAKAAPKISLTPAIPGQRTSRRERMTPLRQRVAARLVESQNTAAMLTTFNEVDMSAIMALRAKHKDAFEKRYGVGLGFMPFFVKAAVHALKQFPQVNAWIVPGVGDATPEVEFHDYYDIAVAVGTARGLVVPVIRDCDRLNFAQIEAAIKDVAARAVDGKLSLDELTGGTFTVSNGGVYGSLMSTPILNPPQTGILGMHAIKNRPIEDPRNPGQIVLRPMMYLALSYDHRLLDGTDSVRFLVTIKQAIEEPERLLFEI